MKQPVGPKEALLKAMREQQVHDQELAKPKKRSDAKPIPKWKRQLTGAKINRRHNKRP